MCTHNGARFVERQLDSILAQSLSVDELHLFDWHSSDGTAGIIERWLAQHVRPPMTAQLRVLESAPGPARSFLQALAQVAANANAGLIFISDQDDTWAPDKVRSFVELYGSGTGPFDLAFSDARVVAADGSDAFPSFYGRGSPYVRPSGALDRSLLVTNPAIGMTMCVRREWLQQVAPVFDRFWIMHDWALMALAWVTGARVRFIDSPLVAYRQHGANALGASMNRSILSRAGRIREHVANVRRQMASLRAAARDLGASGPAAVEVAVSGNRLHPASVAAHSAMLRPHYRALLSGALLLL
jgi:glycosyltransferase involved in cell wall biosynthesis